MPLLAIRILNGGLAIVLDAILAVVMLAPRHLEPDLEGADDVRRSRSRAARILPAIRRRGLGAAGCDRIRSALGRPRVRFDVARRRPPRRI